MIWKLYKYRVKRLVMDKGTFFWLIIFPIVLGTFFWMAFSNITEKSESLDKIDVAIVDDGTYENAVAFDEFIKNVSGKQGNLNTEKLPEDKAEKALDEGEAEGIIYVSDEISLKFKENGLNQTILKSMVDSYIHNENVIMDIIANSPEKAQDVMESLFADVAYTKEVNMNADGNMDVYVQYYFALFAMTCMLGAHYGVINTEEIRAGQRDIAVRRCISPTKRILIVFTDFLAALTVQMLIFVMVFFYLNLFLGIDFGNKYGYILLSGLLSSFVGVAYGYMLGVIVKAKFSIKESIVTSTILSMNFLAGLMVTNMKNLVENNAPVINRINPAAVISDSFYALSVFGDMGMYLRCSITLVAMGTIFGIISVLILRRDKID
ncbi:MAG: ABC transporter permease [Lachnospiraceae bacterium]|nr:ABC transporter permease [Lachnospiraceae bacterium]